MKKNLIFLLLIISTSVTGQISNVQVDKEISFPFLGASMAINPKDPSNIVLSTNLNRVYVSLDSGQTWQKRLILPDLGIIGKSDLLVDRKGKMYLIGRSVDADSEWTPGNIKGGITAFSSDDKGMNWKLEGMIDQTDQYEISDFNSSINVVTGDLYCTWVQKGGEDLEGETPNIYFSMSSNGSNWSKPRAIVYSASTESENTYLSTIPSPGPAGQVYITWANKGKVLLDRTYNKGKTWLRNDIEIAPIYQDGIFDVPDYSGPSGKPVTSMDLSRSNFNGSLYVVWSEFRPGDNGSDIFFIRSSNRGDSWTRPGRISIPAEGSPQFAPVTMVDQATGLLYIAYFSRNEHDDNKSDLFLAWSVDGGGSFKQVKINTDPIDTEGIDNIHKPIALNAFQGIVCPAWINKEGDKTVIISSCLTYKDLGIK